MYNSVAPRKKKHKGPPLREVLCDISRHYDIPIADIIRVNDKNSHVVCRALYCYISYKLTNATLIEIGSEIGRDHSMVIFYRDKVKYWMKSGDPFVDEWFDWLEGTELWGKYEKIRD
jgi:chromosomal replication initiation ATPase DnaA